MEISYLCAPEDPRSFRHAALVVGHPGHELRVFGWVSKHKPRAYILTDGSGHGSVSRVPSTAKVLADLGASQGEIFGIVSDVEFYGIVREQRIEFFLDLAQRLARSFMEHSIDVVVADAIEGYNPAHDLCRAITEASIAMARHRSGHPIADYEFRLTDDKQRAPYRDGHDHRCLHVQLDEELLQGKLRAAREYPELSGEVNRAIALRGAEHFRMECLRKVTEPFPGWPDSHKPYYETYGERQVAQGLYHAVVRYQEHILPLVEAIRRHAAGNSA